MDAYQCDFIKICGVFGLGPDWFSGLVSFPFLCCDKMPERNNLKAGKVYFGSQFQRF
jgi:hypothetical protein